MGDYASHSQGTAGVTLGSIGTATGSLALLGGVCGLFGNMFGRGCGYNNNCNCNNMPQAEYVSHLQAENAALKAENYSDKVAKETYSQSLADLRRTREEIFSYIKSLADEAANNRVKIAQLEGDLRCCCDKQSARSDVIADKFEQLRSRLDNITGEFVLLDKTYPEGMRRYNTWTEPKAVVQSATNTLAGVAVA